MGEIFLSICTYLFPGSNYFNCENCSSLSDPDFGNSTSNSTNKLPWLNASLKNGIPLCFTIFRVWWAIIYPGYVYTFTLEPSKCSNSKLNPVKASSNVIFFYKYKSAPFLLKSGCLSIIIRTYKSPAMIFGPSSPSP